MATTTDDPDDMLAALDLDLTVDLSAVDTLELSSPCETVSDTETTTVRSVDDRTDAESTTSSPAPPSSVDAPGPKPTRKSRPNTTRERIKAELAFLRQKVIDMEQELCALQMENTVIDSTWKRIADHEHARRQHSEAENRRLKKALLGQIEAAKSLEHMLGKRSASAITDWFENEDADERGFAKRARIKESCERMYLRFVMELPGVYARVDALFPRDTPLTIGLESHIHTRIIEDEDHIHIELRDTKLLPFPFERACTAVWTTLRTHFSQETPILETYCLSENHVGALVNCSVEDLLALSAVTAMECTQMADRLVIVWRQMTMPSLRPDEDWEGLYTDETGWIVVDRDDATNTASMRARMHVTPRWCGSKKLQRQFLQAGDFTNFIVYTMQDQVLHVTDAIENVLLEDSLR